MTISCHSNDQDRTVKLTNDNSHKNNNCIIFFCHEISEIYTTQMNANNLQPVKLCSAPYIMTVSSQMHE